MTPRCGLKKRGTQEQCPNEGVHSVAGLMGVQVCDDCFNMSADGKAEIYGSEGILQNSLTHEDRLQLFEEAMHNLGESYRKAWPNGWDGRE